MCGIEMGMFMQHAGVISEQNCWPRAQHLGKGAFLPVVTNTFAVLYFPWEMYRVLTSFQSDHDFFLSFQLTTPPAFCSRAGHRAIQQSESKFLLASRVIGTHASQ